MKKFLALALALMMTLALAACGGGASSTAPTPASTGDSAAPAETGGDDAAASTDAPAGDGPVLTFWNGFTGSDGEILTDIVNRYNESNDKGITIKMDIIPWANFHEQLPTAIATGTAPQMVLCGNDMLPTYVKQGAFLPVEDFFDATGSDKANFAPASLDLFTLDGTLYGIPMQINGMYLYWNKDHFEAAGLDPETPPTTWEELGEMAIQLTDASANQFGFGVATGFMNMEHLLMCSGVTPIDDSAMKSNMNGDAVIEAYKWMQNLTYNEKVSPASTPGGDMDNLLFAGTVSMYINGPWMNNGLVRNGINYGVTTIPAGSDGQRGTLGGCHFGITNGTSDEDVQACYDFINYWNSTEICKEWSMKNGFPPYLVSVAEDPEVAADPIVSELYKALEYAVPVNRGITVMNRINDDVLNPITEEILFAGADPAEKVAEMDEKINALLAEN